MYRTFTVIATLGFCVALPTLLLYTMYFQPRLFPLAFAAALLCTLISLSWNVIASIVHRRRHGRYLLSPRLADALFHERGISGRGDRKLLGLRASAGNCLWIAVLSDRIRVGPMFPFNLMFLPERLGLEDEIPAERVLAVNRSPRRLGRDLITIRYRDQHGDEKQFDLAVRHPDAFLAALRRISGVGSSVEQPHA